MNTKMFFVVFVSIIVTVSAQTLEEGAEQALEDNTVRTLDQAPVKTCTNVNGTGECVPYYLCNNGKFNTDGENVIDIRFNEDKECIEYFEECCGAEHLLTDENKIVPVRNETYITECGIRNSAGVGVRITGNSDGESEYGEFPWMVAVTRREPSNDSFINVYMCGGSLIAENVVMTAAHCVNGKDVDVMRIRVGEWDTQTTFELFQHSDHEVEKFVIHEKFNKGGLHNDIALLFLKTKVEMSEVANTICLPSQDQPFDGKRCFATGWGKDQFGKEGEYQVILKKVELPTVPRDQCQANLRKTRLGRRFILHDSFMCAGGEEGKDTCKGDGGSPLVCPVEGFPDKYYQAGIVAWGVGCGQKDVPGVYANVAHFRNWIDTQIASYSQP
ncbi:unnamed protein product [Chironomus riparius]|uniref:Phenoloxidase-activating factor 2 n=1 Tax=Chironomus riparius TaxID=315576 RepID=A0A9N9RZM0_9DIPT|nr:unnamed protein product [Chironomus riparius]